MSPVTDGIGILRNRNGNKRRGLRSREADLGDDTETLTDFVRELLEQVFDIGNLHDITLVILSDFKSAAIGVCECAKLLQKSYPAPPLSIQPFGIRARCLREGD
jgi:hypothetical protein